MACGDGPVGDMKRVSDAVDAICACKDAECHKKAAAEANKKMGKAAMEELGERYPDEMKEIMTKLVECTAKFATDTANRL